MNLSKLRLLALLLLLTLPALSQNFATISGSNVYGTGNTLLPSGTLVWQPVSSNGSPIGYQVGGGGQQITSPTICSVVNGVIQSGCQIANTAFTNPKNVCFALTIKDSNNTIVSPPSNGYSCVQPGGNSLSGGVNYWCSITAGQLTCDLDQYIPNNPTVVTALMPAAQVLALGGIYSGLCQSAYTVIGIAPATGQIICGPGGGAGGSPGGSVGQLQFNNTVFGGVPGSSVNGTYGTIGLACISGGTSDCLNVTGDSSGYNNIASFTPYGLSFPSIMIDPNGGLNLHQSYLNLGGSPKGSASYIVDSGGGLGQLGYYLQDQGGGIAIWKPAPGVNWGQIAGTLSAQTDLWNALQLLAPTNSPSLTGTPTAPTPSSTDNSTKIATTAWVQEQGYGTSGGNVSWGGGSSVANDVTIFCNTTGKSICDSGVLYTALAPLASPVFTGNPTAPTQSTGDSSTKIATDAFVKNQNYCPIAGCTFTGNVGGLTNTEVGLGNVTNNAQAWASIYPNTAPTSAQILVGGSGGAYVAQTLGGDCSLSLPGNITCTKSSGVSFGTAAFLNAGTAANNVVQLNGSGYLPTLNGSLLTNVAAVTAASLASTPTLCATGNAPTGILANGNATGCAPISGSGSSITVNGGSALGSPANFQNGPAFDGLTINALNPSGNNIDFQLSGALTNAGLVNSSLTLNGQTVALGGIGNIPFQTIGTNNTSLAGVNFIASTVNAVGLVATPVNPGTNQEKWEITGTSYSGNASTASALAGTPTQCSSGNAPTGILANGNATGCQTLVGNAVGSQYSIQYSANGTGAFGGFVSNIAGQIPVFQHNAAPVAASPGLPDSVNSPVTSSGYTIACDSTAAIIDRTHLLRFQSGASAPIVPLSTATGCTGGFVFGVMDDGAGALTFSASSPDTFSVFGGTSPGDGQTSVTLQNWQFATFTQGATGIWEVRITGGGTGASENVVTFSSTPTFSATATENIIILTGSVTSSTLAAGTPGQQMTMIICQDSIGSRPFAWPSGMRGVMTVGAAAGTCSSQPFTYSGNQTAWMATGTGVINE